MGDTSTQEKSAEAPQDNGGASLLPARRTSSLLPKVITAFLMVTAVGIGFYVYGMSLALEGETDLLEAEPPVKAITVEKPVEKGVKVLDVD